MKQPFIVVRRDECGVTVIIGRFAFVYNHQQPYRDISLEWRSRSKEFRPWARYESMVAK